VDGEDDCPVRGGVASVHFELIDAENPRRLSSTAPRASLC
jgi:hypothetical protein